MPKEDMLAGGHLLYYIRFESQLPFACDALGISERAFPCKLCFAQALPFYHGPWWQWCQYKRLKEGIVISCELLLWRENFLSRRLRGFGFELFKNIFKPKNRSQTHINFLVTGRLKDTTYCFFNNVCIINSYYPIS